MYAFELSPPDHGLRRRRAISPRPRRQAPGRRHDAAADHEAAARVARSASIDLTAVEDLAGIDGEGRASSSIGADDPPCRRRRRARTSRKAIPALAELAGLIGDPHVRNTGTIGGSVANNDPAADYPAACLALGATIVTNKRQIAADDFFTGLVRDGARGRASSSPR